MNEQDKKVPTLRFKGFTNDWEQRKLGKVIVDYKKKNNNDRLPVLTSSFQGIEYQEKHFGSKQKHDTSNYNVLPKGYMTYRNRSDNGYFKFNINKLGVTGIVSKFYPVFTTIDTNKQFLASYINYNYRLKNHFKVVSVGTSQHVLSLKNLKKTDLLFPSKSEQNQIGEFFNLLNKIIDLQQRKLDLLKQLKKGLLQKMFADKDSKRPILRFNGFTDDWEQRKLGKVIVDYKKKNNNDRLPVLTSSFQGIEYQEKHFGSKQKHDTSNYNVLPKGYMTYRNRSDNGYFKFNINKLGVTGIVSKFYPVFTTIDTNKQFLASYMNYNYRLKNHFKVVSVGTSQHVLSLRNLKKTDLLFPSKSEQDQIGEFFNLLNKRIDLQQQKLKKISKVKESFLQQMFI